MTYKFDEFKWLSNMAGFRVPVDVYYGSVYLGLIESAPDGYTIQLVDTPNGGKIIKQGGKNKFKSKQDAAETLHKAWRLLRTNMSFSGSSISDEDEDNDEDDEHGEEWKKQENVNEWEGPSPKSPPGYDKEWTFWDGIGWSEEDSNRWDEFRYGKNKPSSIATDYVNSRTRSSHKKKNKTSKGFADGGKSDEFREKLAKEKMEKIKVIRDRKRLASKKYRADKKAAFDKLPNEEKEKILLQQKIRKNKLKQNGWDKFITGLKLWVKQGKIDIKSARRVIEKRWQSIKNQFKETEV